MGFYNGVIHVQPFRCLFCMFTTFQVRVNDWRQSAVVQWILVITTAFVPKEAIKMDFLL